MASYNKNVFVGTGGSEGINKSHFLGAVYGMERIMGRADTPVRKVLNYASDHFARHLPIVYVLTVVGATQAGPVTRGLFVGDDVECFHKACELALKVNFTMLDEPLKKVVVYLDPEEFKTTWLGNKSVYRTRMAMADGGELIVLAPGLKEFGEDKGIDKLIRKYGYVGTDRVLQLVRQNEDLRSSLGAAAHLIHGSTEGRFTVTYCPGSLTKQEIESVNFQYADLRTMAAKYDPVKLKNGFNKVAGEDIFYISNPGLGLWSTRARFNRRPSCYNGMKENQGSRFISQSEGHCPRCEIACGCVTDCNPMARRWSEAHDGSGIRYTEGNKAGQYSQFEGTLGWHNAPGSLRLLLLSRVGPRGTQPAAGQTLHSVVIGGSQSPDHIGRSGGGVLA